MKKTFLLAFVLLTLFTYSYAANDHDSHKLDPNVPFKKAMDKMHKGMNVKSTENIDLDFLKGMIPHHQGAIDMSEELIKKTKDPELKAFAEKIIKDQKAEIKQMQEMLKKKEKK
jgi:uncharacterized protein (DUF305 family)